MSFTIFGTGGRGMGVKVARNIFFLLLTYLRSVLIFIKQYSDSMCFLPFLAENYELYLLMFYLCEIDVRIPTSWSS